MQNGTYLEKHNKTYTACYTESLFSMFDEIPDPRRTKKGNLLFPLHEILFLMISGAVCGITSDNGLATFGELQITWLREFFPYKNGTPSHDVIGRVLKRLDTAAFTNAFIDWIEAIRKDVKNEVIAIDGKTIRGANSNSTIGSVHVVSAFAVANGLCLGQVSTDLKSNEITAIPELLKLIAVKGCTISIDAIGCQTAIVDQIIDKEADYILAVKQNQKNLYNQVTKLFDYYPSVDAETQLDFGHGRIETRKCSVISDLNFLDDKEHWKNLRSIVKIESTREIKKSGKITKDTRYYISSLYANSEYFNLAIRSHWGIENKLHWILDVVFKEDASTKQKDNSPANTNVLSKIAMTLLRQQNTPKKLSGPQKMLCATYDLNFRNSIFKS